MFLRMLKSGQPVLLFFIPLFGGLLWLKYFLLPQPVTMEFEPNPMPLYQWLSSLLEETPFLSRLLALGMTVMLALLLSRFNAKFIILQRRTYLPSVLYLLIISSYLPLQQMNPALIAALFLMISLEIIIGSDRKEGLALSFFQAAFFIAVGSLFYARAAILMLVVWTGLSIFRSLNLREWLFTFLGFLLPYVYLFSWYFLRDQDLVMKWEAIKMNFMPDRLNSMYDYVYLVFYIYLIFLLLLASQRMIADYRTLKIFIRKVFRFYFWIFAFVIAAYAILYSRSVEFIYFSGIPIAYILSYYLLNIRNKFAGEIIILLLLTGMGAILMLA